MTSVPVVKNFLDEPVEMELKLVLRGQEDESAVVACLRENNYTVEEIEPVQHVDTYLDTFDWLLLKNKTCAPVPRLERYGDVYAQEHRTHRGRDRQEDGEWRFPSTDRLTSRPLFR